MFRQKSTKLLLLAGVALSLAFSTTPSNREFEITKNLEIFANLYRELNKGYVDEIDPSVLMRTGLEAMVSSLDPFTNYWPESEIERSRILQEGNSSGVGLSFSVVDKKVLVTDVFKGMAADKSGVKIGDEITAVDGPGTEYRRGGLSSPRYRRHVCGDFPAAPWSRKRPAHYP
jgi:carboxyl-terminal processing protease